MLWLFVALVVVGLLKPFEDYLAVGGFACQIREEQKAQFQVVYRAALHCLQILLFVYALPIDNFRKGAF